MKKNKKLKLVIGWLYPTLMNLYGDRGNIITLKYRCEKRDIVVKIRKIGIGNKFVSDDMDLVFFGGGQDRQQIMIRDDLLKKAKDIKEYFNQNKPMLTVCGGYQLLGNYFKTHDGKKIKGLGIFNMYTVGAKKRMIGNVIAKTELDDCEDIVGFENHSGNTMLADRADCFASVFRGYGNNDLDRTEGMKVNNFIGTYLHGPLLPKNYELADWFIMKALEIKYKKSIKLKKIDNSFEIKAKDYILDNY